MSGYGRNKGFSLTEVMLAAGILAIGFMLIISAFPLGIKLTAESTEAAVGASATQEAFAKVRLYGVKLGDLTNDSQTLFDKDLIGADAFINITDVITNDYNLANQDTALRMILEQERLYPSVENVYLKAAAEEHPDDYVYERSQSRYYWSALCRSLGGSSVQVTVFISRMADFSVKYYTLDAGGDVMGDHAGETPSDFPLPLKVEVSRFDDNILEVDDNEKFRFFTEYSQIAADSDGGIYRVMELDPQNGYITLDRNWMGDDPDAVWVVPPPIGSGRYPCAGVYQRVISF